MPTHAYRLLALVAALVLVAPCCADEPADHWAWKKPERPKVPVVAGAQLANPIDAFIRAKLADAKLAPAPPATREQLISASHSTSSGFRQRPKKSMRS